MVLLIILLVAIVLYAFSGEGKQAPTLKAHVHSSGFVIVVCLVAIVVFMVMLGSVHVPGQ